MPISKSRYLDFLQCPKKLWLNTYKRELADEMDQSIFTMGTNVGELARDLFPGGVLVEYHEDEKKNLVRMISETKRLMQEGTEIIYEAAFSDGRTLAICDVLVKNGEGYDIYEVKASSSVKDVHIQDMAFQTQVLVRCGVQVFQTYLVHINNLYTRRGELDIFQLFAAENITAAVCDQLELIEDEIQKADDILLRTTEPSDDIGMHCTNPYVCQFQGHCYSHIPKNSIFDLAGTFKRKKFSLYNKGILTFEDVVENGIQLKDKAMMQIDARLNGTETTDEKAVKEFLDTLWYPLYFLDFETINSAIPLFDGTRPYQQVPTQYSLHYIEYEGGPLQHSEYLAPAGVDPRRPLAEKLAEDIPLNACVLAYNMSFEKSVIASLASQYAGPAGRLTAIHTNIRDLMIPFQKRHVYRKEMKGSYSIKAVLPALFPNDPELSYGTLEGVHNGQEAAAAYVAMLGMPPKEQVDTQKQLLEYCKLDTLAMVRLWEWLMKNSG